MTKNDFKPKDGELIIAYLAPFKYLLGRKYNWAFVADWDDSFMSFDNVKNWKYVADIFPTPQEAFNAEK